MRRTARWLVIGAAAISAVTACRDAFGIAEVYGVWETTSINGYPVPGIVVVDGEDYDAEYWRWTLIDGGFCTFDTLIDGESDTDDCDYTVNLEERTIAISMTDWGMYLHGSIDGDRMDLLDSDDMPWVLQRQ